MIDPHHRSARWTLETVPERFWARIDVAAGDSDRFLASLGELDAEGHYELIDQFSGLATALVVPRFDELPEAIREQDILKTEELADCVISQGREAYVAVLREPARFPEVRTRPNYCGCVVESCMARFGSYRARE